MAIMKARKIIAADIDSLIVEVRRQKVILDAGLASIYGVTTKALNQADYEDSRSALRTPTPPEPSKPEIGFHIRENTVRYRGRRKSHRL